METINYQVTEIDHLSRENVEYNVWAMARTMARIERKIERARSEKVIAKLKRQYFDEQFYWLSNVQRLAKFRVLNGN